MKLSELKNIISDAGVLCASWFIDNSDAVLPFAVVSKPANGENFYADNHSYVNYDKFSVMLVLGISDEKTEEIVDNALIGAGINFTYVMFYESEQQVCVKIYNFEN